MTHRHDPSDYRIPSMIAMTQMIDAHPKNGIEIAEEVGISQSTVSSVYRNEQDPKLDTVRRLVGVIDRQDEYAIPQDYVVREMREDLGINRPRLAKEADVPNRSVKHIEKGQGARWNTFRNVVHALDRFYERRPVTYQPIEGVGFVTGVEGDDDAHLFRKDDYETFCGQSPFNAMSIPEAVDPFCDECLVQHVGLPDALGEVDAPLWKVKRYFQETYL